ncbi:MAG: pitrilysin family protein [Saprospiraceae bacterium]
MITHFDPENPLASVDIHYHVGSRDDHLSQTGMAHLMEHLMFSGTEQVPSFDMVVQNAGGENNAFTTCDSTNYNITLPVSNLAIALMVEADRMQHIKISKANFEREKQVVLEEFKETCLNKPYGESFHLLSQLSYQKHPYRWPTIGKDVKTIASLKLRDAQNFYKTYYQPANAVLSINSNMPSKEILVLVEKYFGYIKSKPFNKKSYPIEKRQKKLRSLRAAQRTPADAIYLAFHMGSRMQNDFYVADVISDVLSNGHSTRLFKKMVRGKKLVSMIDASITGSLDPGLFIIEAKAIPGKSIREVERAIWEELNDLKTKLISSKELTKMKNTIEASLLFSEVNGLNKAITLGFFEILGNADWANLEGTKYQSITREDIKAVSKKIFRKNNCNIIYYKRSVDGAGYFEEDEEDD